jgi:hypothetical protein
MLFGRVIKIIVKRAGKLFIKETVRIKKKLEGI